MSRRRATLVTQPGNGPWARPPTGGFTELSSFLSPDSATKAGGPGGSFHGRGSVGGAGRLVLLGPSFAAKATL